MDTVGQVIRMGNMREGYVAVAQAVAKHGEKVSPRGQDTREFQSTTLIVEDPFDTLPTGVGRGLVPGIAAVESAQLLAGETRPKLTIAVSPTFANFTENNGLFHGAYGPRTAQSNQFPRVIDRLKHDPSSRQAIVTIWDKDLDLRADKRDYPCTVLYHFMIRNDRLIMETVMRSNDVILGLGYDAFQHSRVQIAVASVLDIEPGEYRHHAMSLHLYERDLDKVDQLHMPEGKPPSYMPAITGESWSEVCNRARTCLDMAETPDKERKLAIIDTGAARAMEWYVKSMRDAIKKNRRKEKVSG